MKRPVRILEPVWKVELWFAIKLGNTVKKILINFAHPARSRSKINTTLRKQIDALENVTINDLYSHYPDFLIDVKREQKLCEDHDIIIFQFPFYWYSSPSIVKEWMDLVLEHGWAYGSQGKALMGKHFMLAISGGGDASTYNKEGFNEFTIAELTSPMRATAKLCNLTWLPPFTILGIHRGLPEDQLRVHSANYRRLILALRDGTCDLSLVQQHEFINSDLNSVIKEQ